MRIIIKTSNRPLLLIIVSLALALSDAFAVEEGPLLRAAGSEEPVFLGGFPSCKDSFLLDSPARALRRFNGALVLYATHINNWYMAGPDWIKLKPVCASAIQSAENPDPAAVDDHHWIQGLASDDGLHVIALASHEYLGSRHGQCDAEPTKTQPFPCWFSSITQFESRDGALSFRPATENRIAATPQVPFDKSKTGRMGFLTTSNIVTDGDWRYVLIYVDGYGGQKSGTCIFRAAKSLAAPRWLGWDGQSFRAELDKIALKPLREGSASGCAPLTLGSINRGLVRHRASGVWVAVGQYRRHHADNPQPGIYYSLSKDLLHWGEPRLLVELTIGFQVPNCPPVYKYPSVIDHDAPGFAFDTVGDRAYLYLTKVLFENCKYAGRKLVRIPLAVTEK
jgi:hypothetical protein